MPKWNTRSRKPRQAVQTGSGARRLRSPACGATIRANLDRRSGPIPPPPLSEDFVLTHSDPVTGLPVGPRPARASTLDSEALLAVILASVEDDKAEDVVKIDLRGRSDMADHMVICSGRSTRQVTAISDKLADRLKQDHGRLVRIEGKDTGDWVLIDAGDVIVHVFRPEVRDFYQLEKMWLPGGTQALDAPE